MTTGNDGREPPTFDPNSLEFQGHIAYCRFNSLTVEQLRYIADLFAAEADRAKN